MFSTICRAAVVAGGVMVWAAGVAAQAIPIKPGVVLTYATQPIDTTQREDFEREITIDTVTADEIRMSDVASNVLKPSMKVGEIRVLRPESHREIAMAREIWLGNISPDVDPHRGSSWMAASAAVMRLLRTNGEAEVTIGSTAIEGSATLKRVNVKTEPETVQVNGKPVVVQTIHAHVDVTPQLNQMGTGFRGIGYDFWFLDDTAVAWIVKETGIEKFADGPKAGTREGLQQLVRVQWGDEMMGSAIKGALAKGCGAQFDASGIHFATASAQLTASSTPSLKAIADVMAKQPTWNLTIEGHTDSLGGAAYNKDLSERRAASVKAALTTQYGIAAGRLTTIGYGLTRPVDSNSTLVGRAKNRRVQLTRKC
jgi:outer membrane protein OmpA-like peptidoglycan-associated protein